jgi:hypothetical protein
VQKTIPVGMLPADMIHFHMASVHRSRFNYGAWLGFHYRVLPTRFL